MKFQKLRLFDEVQQDVEQEEDVEMSEAMTITIEEDRMRVSDSHAGTSGAQ